MVEERQITIFDASSESLHQDYKLSVDELQSELVKFNLTSNQAKVYIFLGKYGSKTAPEVCKALKIARTETYHLLSTLQKKGIVSATFEHPIKFTALPVNKAMSALVNAEKERLKILEKQEKQVTKLWENIPDFAQEEIQNNENKFQMLQGTNPINGKLTEMITTSKKEMLVLGSEKDYLKLYHSDFLSDIADKKINAKIITSCSEKTEYVFEGIKKNIIRKTESNIDDKLCFIIKDNEEMVFFTKNNSHGSQEIMAMWTDSSTLICSMKLLFDFIWSSSNPL